MSLWIEWEVEVPELTRMSWETLFGKVTEAALKEEQVSVPCEISLTLTTPEAIQEINRDFRGIDRVTDVLSFPQFEYDGKDAASFLSSAEVDPDTNEVLLGDIVICLERARQQAEEYGHSLERELGFLAAHSMLHLMGYDHMVESEEKIMFAKQEEILASVGLTREAPKGEQ